LYFRKLVQKIFSKLDETKPEVPILCQFLLAGGTLYEKGRQRDEDPPVRSSWWLPWAAEVGGGLVVGHGERERRGGDWEKIGKHSGRPVVRDKQGEDGAAVGGEREVSGEI
jgi:hypothetical protein